MRSITAIFMTNKQTILSGLVLFCPVMPCPVLSCPVLSYPVVLSCLLWSRLVTYQMGLIVDNDGKGSPSTAIPIHHYKLLRVVLKLRELRVTFYNHKSFIHHDLGLGAKLSIKSSHTTNGHQ